MTAARRILRPSAAALTGLALAVGGLVVAAPTVSAAQEPGWDHQTCDSHGAPARQVELTSPGVSAMSYTYWVDEAFLATATLGPSGDYSYVLPPVPVGAHRWKSSTKFDGKPDGPGTAITTPECPADPDVPATPPESEAPSAGLTLLRVDEAPVCRLESDGSVSAPVGYSHLNGDSTKDGTLEVRVDGELDDSYVVPKRSGRAGRLDLSPGTHTVDLGVAGQDGPGKTVDVTVPDCSADLAVTPGAAVVKPGGSMSVRAKGATPGEALRLRLSGVTIAEGLADDSGAATLRGTVPKTFTAMNNRTVQVRGASATRTGTARLSTVLPKTLRPTVWKSTVPRGSTQRVTVTGLAPKERAVVVYGGRWISPSGSAADARGRYTLRFDPDARPGRRTVTVRGLDDTRRGSVTFTLR